MMGKHEVEIGLNARNGDEYVKVFENEKTNDKQPDFKGDEGEFYGKLSGDSRCEGSSFLYSQFKLIHSDPEHRKHWRWWSRQG